MENEIIEAMMMGANEINRLRNENQKLQQRIDKAIKYINKNQVGYASLINCTIPIEELFTTNMELLNILKGESK